MQCSILNITIRWIGVAAFAVIWINNSSAEDWSPLWSTAQLSQARDNLTATSAGGLVFFAGGDTAGYRLTGGGGGGPYSNVVDIYNTSNGVWSTATLSQARTLLSATSLGNQFFFAGGLNDGGSSNVVDILNTSAGTWSTATLSVARSNLAASSAGDKVVFAGGQNSQYLNTVDIYDTSTGNWSTAALSQTRSDLAATSVGNDLIFAGGDNNLGTSGNNAVDIYDTSAGTWSTATLSQGRWVLAATSLGNQAFFGGGLISNGGPFSNAVDIYNKSTNTWSTATLSQARAGLAAASAGNKVLFAGGFDYTTGYSNVVDIYNTSTNTWSTSTLSQARGDFEATSVGNQVFFAGGWTGSAASNVVDIYTVQDYPSISSTKSFTLCDQTTVAGLMQLNAPGSLALGAFNLAVGSMSGNAPIDLGSSLLTTGSDNTSTTYSGVLSGSGSFSKIGSGKLVLATSNSYTGSTTLNAGTIYAGVAGALSSSSDFVVNGGTLDASASTQTIDSLNVASSGVLTLQLGKLLTASDSSSLSGTLNVLGLSGTGELLSLPDGYSGTFTSSNLPIGDTLIYKPNEVDVAIATPEPSTLALLGIGLTGLFSYGWRRRATRRIFQPDAKDDEPPILALRSPPADQVSERRRAA